MQLDQKYFWEHWTINPTLQSGHSQGGIHTQVRKSVTTHVSDKLCKNFVKELVILFHRTAAAPRSASSFNSLTFFEIPKILRTLLVRDVTRTLSPVPSSQAIVTSLSDKSALCAGARYHLHQGCTQPTYAPSRKAPSPTKPKGMNRNPSAIILQRYCLQA